MNDSKSIEEQYGYINSLLNHRRLKEALTQLEPFVAETTDYELRGKCESIATSYRYLLQYMSEGAPDPERINMYNHLLAQAYELNGQTRCTMLDERSNRYYYQNRRTYILMGAKAPQMAQIVERLERYSDDIALSQLISPQKRKEVVDSYESALKDIFMTTWCNRHWSGSEADTAHAMLQSERIQANALSLMVSAVMLSTMECFDLRKMEWLCDAYLYDNVQVSQRALVAIVAVCLTHSERIGIYPSLKARMEHLAESSNLSADLSRLYLQLLLCQETEKIGRKVRDEIIPEVMKKAYEIRNHMKDIERDDDEEMPEWSEIISRTGIDDSMRKLNEMQAEGADVQMATFSTQKSYTYFREMHHWLYPFDSMQQDVLQGSIDTLENKTANLIINSGMFCDSDKYSLYFLLCNMPQKEQEQMFSTMAINNEEIAAEIDEQIKHSSSDPAFVCNSYLHDLYRFFNLYMYHREFHNIFSSPIELHKIDLLKEMTGGEAELYAISAYHLRKENWEMAADVIRQIVDMHQSLATSAELYQKLGYALQKSRHINEAIEAYLTADTIKPNTLWTEKRLATCYRLAHSYEKALQMYSKIEEGGNGNANITYYTACCLVELNRCAEALNIFFKLDFSEEQSVRAWRGIGWCSFVIGKYEQAMKYYSKVVEVKPSAGEYMNMGHVAWCMGDLPQAVALYRKATAGMGREELIDTFAAESCYLTERGISPDEISLMIDLL